MVVERKSELSAEGAGFGGDVEVDRWRGVGCAVCLSHRFAMRSVLGFAEDARKGLVRCWSWVCAWSG